MINIDTQIRHWRESSLEEWDVAKELMGNRRIRHALFWGHLALEKMLKAHVCKQTRDLSPRIHNLARLTELADLHFDEDTRDFLFEVNKYNLIGRYIEHQGPVPDFGRAQQIMERIEEVLTCLNKTL